jgi:virginiamycin A acetyltransferase
MGHLKEWVPGCIKDYLRILAAKLRHPGCFIDSPWVGKGVVLGRGCLVHRGAELANAVRMDEYSYVNCGAIVASGRIGRFCSIGPYAIIGMPDHPTNYPATSPMLYGSRNIFGRPCSWNDFPSPPVIGSDVWIGAHAFVKQGVRIGHGAIVGASAVVTRDVPPYAIVAGVPARVIRYRFAPEIVEELLRSCWWELDTRALESRAAEFDRVLDCLPQFGLRLQGACQDDRRAVEHEASVR